MSPTINGVKNPSKKFQSQLEAVASAMALERYLEGYSSAMIVQTMGPHVVANPRIKRQANTISAFPACGVFSGVFKSSAK